MEETEKTGTRRPVIGIDISAMRNFLEGLLKNMQGGVFTLDMDQRIVSFNKAAEWITGYCLDDVLGKSCKEILSSEICEKECAFSRVMRRGVPVHRAEMELKAKDGKPIPVDMSCFPLSDNKDRLCGMVGIFRDTSELHALRGQLMHSEKLALLGQLAAGVAHEVNNPINGILTYIRLLLKKIDRGELESMQADLVRYLEVMERETVHIGRTVSNLLDFSRRSQPDISMVDLNDVISQSLLLVRDQLNLSNITVKRDGQVELPEIMADFGQLQQIMVNLLLNAAQAMRDGGEITITTVAEGTRGSECFVAVEVHDTGCGISEENLSRIFDPFFTTKGGKDGVGLGLGLSIVHRIVREHHGRIEVKSKVNEGTVFTIKLPT
jgi:two-component system NtrC family sensor kinase